MYVYNLSLESTLPGAGAVEAKQVRLAWCYDIAPPMYALPELMRRTTRLRQEAYNNLNGR